jgi:hypothetical protein
LWIAIDETTASKLASANGSARMSPSTTATRSPTPSAAAFASVASRRLSDWSAADHMSTPTARPPGRRFAAPISSSPRPQPTSSRSSSPDSPSPSRSRSRSSSLPRRLEWIIAATVARNMTAPRPNSSGATGRPDTAKTTVATASSAPAIAKPRTTPGASSP